MWKWKNELSKTGPSWTVCVDIRGFFIRWQTQLLHNWKHAHAHGQQCTGREPNEADVKHGIYHFSWEPNLHSIVIFNTKNLGVNSVI